MKIFVKRFSKTLGVTVEVSDVPPERGSHILGTRWDGQCPLNFRPYIAWMNQVNQSMAEEWNEPIAHIYMTGGVKSETWLYRPGKRPKRTKVTT